MADIRDNGSVVDYGGAWFPVNRDHWSSVRDNIPDDVRKAAGDSLLGRATLLLDSAKECGYWIERKGGYKEMTATTGTAEGWEKALAGRHGDVKMDFNQFSAQEVQKIREELEALPRKESVEIPWSGTLHILA